MKRVFKLCVVCIFTLGILSTCLFTCSAYSNQYPEYLNYADCAYIEINSNLGIGSVVIPHNYQFEYLTIYNDNTIANIGTNTISGYFISQNGTSRQIRITSLGTLQYYYSQGYQTYYEDLTFSEILNTNINLNSVSSSAYDKVFNFSTYEILMLVMCALYMFCVPVVKMLGSRGNYGRTL